MTSTFLARAANMTQKTVVVGLLGMFSYHTFQITKNVVVGIGGGTTQHETMKSTYFDDVKKQVEEEYQTNYGRTDKRDWYDKDDQSYLQGVPRGVKPKTTPKKENELQQ